jgi:hypothetical protein
VIQNRSKNRMVHYQCVAFGHADAVASDIGLILSGLLGLLKLDRYYVGIFGTFRQAKNR